MSLRQLASRSTNGAMPSARFATRPCTVGTPETYPGSPLRRQPRASATSFRKPRQENRAERGSMISSAGRDTARHDRVLLLANVSGVRSRGPAMDEQLSRLRVGDHVQWTSDGVDQFKPARKITKIQDRHVWVRGSQTGIPINEVTVVQPLAAIPDAKLTTSAKSLPSGKNCDGNQINVLVTPQGRLQISADLDVEGLGTLRQMLEQYEQILRLLQKWGRRPTPLRHD